MKFLRASALLTLAALAAPAAWAAPDAAGHAGALCSIDVEGAPGQKFLPGHIAVPASCEYFTVRLLHIGKNSKEQAGHNWALMRSEDTDAVLRDGLPHGADHDWLDPQDARVIARTEMLGGGHAAAVTFPVRLLKAGEPYTYVCSFPAHAEKMRGTLELAD